MYGPPPRFLVALPVRLRVRVGPPVERMGQSDGLVFSTVPLGQPGRALDRLGPAVAEEGLLEIAGGDLSQLLGQVGDHLDVIEVGRTVDQPLHLPSRGRQHGFVSVAGVDHRDAGETVDEARAVVAEVGRALGPVDHQRVDGRQEPGVDVLLVLLPGVHLGFSFAEYLSWTFSQDLERDGESCRRGAHHQSTAPFSMTTTPSGETRKRRASSSRSSPTTKPAGTCTPLSMIVREIRASRPTFDAVHEHRVDDPGSRVDPGAGPDDGALDPPA